MKIDYNNANIPNRHKKFRPKDNHDEVWLRNYTNAKSYIEQGSIIALIGNRGTGKTQMACCLVGYACEMGKNGQYYKAMDIFLQIRHDMKHSSEHEAVKSLVKPFVLVIDAYEVRADSDFENRITDHIIDKRYDEMKTTIIVSNDVPDKFASNIGPSTLDRIKESGVLINFTGKSFRR